MGTRCPSSHHPSSRWTAQGRATLRAPRTGAVGRGAARRKFDQYRTGGVDAPRGAEGRVGRAAAVVRALHPEPCTLHPEP